VRGFFSLVKGSTDQQSTPEGFDRIVDSSRSSTRSSSTAELRAVSVHQVHHANARVKAALGDVSVC